jgi:hypothetical protein
MTPAECGFWARLRHALRAQGMELFVLAHHDPQGDADVPVLRVRNEFRSVPVDDGTGWRAWKTPALPFDPAPYLAREQCWNGPPANAAAEAQRLAALHFFHDFYRTALRDVRPVMALIWNGQHPQEMLLANLCRTAGCPVHYLERAPIAGALHVDPEGILAGSTIARATTWTWPSDDSQAHWHAVAAQVAEAAAKATWWEQPASRDPATLRRKLGIRAGQQVLLFAGQVDRDTQNLLYSPHFTTNAEALAWCCAQLPADGSIFLLGKHHPKSTVPAAVYREIVGSLGVWTEDVAIADALALADRVAAVNSTVLFEGLLRGKPALALGASLLDGKGIAYEVTGPAQGSAVVAAWRAAADFDARAARWQDFLAYLLGHAFYTMDPSPGGQQGVDALAAHLAANATTQAAVDYDVLGVPRGFPEVVGELDTWRARGVPHQGFKEVLRGLHICARALLEPCAPALYAAAKSWADRMYGPRK